MSCQDHGGCHCSAKVHAAEMKTSASCVVKLSEACACQQWSAVSVCEYPRESLQLKKHGGREAKHRSAALLAFR